MNTPICDFLVNYQKENRDRFHMPGHKGKGEALPLSFDVTEVEGADVLYGAEGIIAESENNASALFGTAHSFYSTEGSSLCIRAMVALCSSYAKEIGRKNCILAARNAHVTFLTATALCDVDVQWLYGKQSSLLSCVLRAAEVEEALNESEELPVAVYLTSPDYLGNLCDVAAIAKICHEKGVLLLVDNAHGAYLQFLPESAHPIAMGADLVCDSAHKTLSALTGSAYLHVSQNAPAVFCERARQALRLFASTSPSYLILASLDRLNQSLADGFSARLYALGDKIFNLKKKLREKGYLVRGEEPLKITLLPKPMGYTGDALKEILYRKGMVAEFSDPDHLVLMLTPDNSEEEIAHLEKVLLSLPCRNAITTFPPRLPHGERVMSPREALFSPSHTLPIDRALGEVLAQPSVSCPPAVPIALCGERLCEDAIRAFRYYGILSVSVIKR